MSVMLTAPVLKLPLKVLFVIAYYLCIRSLNSGYFDKLSLLHSIILAFFEMQRNGFKKQEIFLGFPVFDCLWRRLFLILIRQFINIVSIIIWNGIKDLHVFNIY